MSAYDYYKSREILNENPTFDSLIMAACEKASTETREKIKKEFPSIVYEFQKRRKNVLGLLDGDEFQITFELNGRVNTFKKVYREV